MRGARVNRILSLFGCLWLLAISSYAQSVIRLWQGVAPGALGNEEKDIPTLTVTLPDSGKANGTAIVICPGGGYEHLADKEGADYARFLAMHGVTGFVLKYRLGSDGYRHPAMLDDVTRALRLVRSGAAAWKIFSAQIVISAVNRSGIV